MAVQIGCAVAQVLSTDVAGTNIDVNVGFTPVAGQYAVIIFWNGNNFGTDIVSSASISPGIGIGVSSTSRRCVIGTSTDGASPNSVAVKSFYTDAIVGEVAANGRLDLTGVITNGVRLTVKTSGQFVATLKLLVFVIGGLTGAAIDSVLSPAATGNATHTLGVSNPDLLIFTNPGPVTTTLTNQSSLQLGLGAAKASNSAQFNLGFISRNGVSTAGHWHYNTDQECLGSVGVTGLAVERASFVSVSGTTLTLNWLERQATGNIYNCLSIAGIGCAVAQGLTQTDTTTTIPITGLSSTCLGGIVLSCCEPESTQDVPAANNHASFGAFNGVGTNQRAAMGLSDLAATIPTKSALGIEYDEVYENVSASDTNQGLMDVQSLDSGGATFIMDLADPAQKAFYAILFSDVGGGAAAHAGGLTNRGLVASKLKGLAR